MKTKITSFLLILFSIVTFGQTELERQKIIAGTNIAELNRLKPIYDSVFRAQKAEAVAKAKVQGWPLTKSEKNGGISELIRLDKEGNPIYFSTDNAGAAITTRANKLNSGGSLGLNLDGQNMNIALWDGGKVRNTHALLTGRVNQVDDAGSLSAHATHVAGTMIGNATASPSAKGMASQANLLAHDWNDDLGEVASAAANGLLVSNHSYGNNPDSVSLDRWGKYDTDARSFDRIMFNAPYYQFVNSAGNSRNDGHNDDKNGFDLLSGKSTSKNGIIVAAVNQVTNYTGPTSVGMSSFSSWGPTDDGRIKPDISGKGVNLRSSVSGSNTAYSSYSGTSMSSPNVAGTLLLLQQHHNNLKGNYMKASTLKGLALHTADEAGSFVGPDYIFGWGLLNAEKAAQLITNEGVKSRIKEQTLLQGDTYTFNITAFDNTQMAASICWTDPWGPIINNSIVDYAVPVLINDLDLRITKNAETNFPWKLNPADVDSPATKGDNIVDNIEKIEISNPSSIYTVTVSHKKSLLNGLQNYSLVLSNIAANKILLSTNKPLVNSICAGTTTSTFDFRLETIPTFNETATFSVSGLPNGVLENFQENTVATAGLNNLQLSNLEAVPVGSYPIIVTATSATATSNLFFTLLIQNQLTGAPSLFSPTNNSVTIDENPTLNWQNIGTNVLDYTIQIAKDPNFSTGLQTVTSITNQKQVSNLAFGTKYYWRVKSNNICSESSFSSIYEFTTPCSNNIVVTVSNININGATLTWTNPNQTTIFDYELVPSGSTPTGVYTNINTNNFTFDSLNSFSNYTFYLRSGCGENSFSNVINKSFATLINHCVDGVFFDSGNSNNYNNNELKVTTISPNNPNDKVTINFTSFDLENQSDYLYLYDGPLTTSPFIGLEFGYTGTNSPGTITSTHPTGKLTFLFYSDGINTAPGWTATVSCAGSLATNNYYKNNFSFYPNPATNQVTFSGTETIKNISIVNVFGQILKKTKVSSKQATIDISDMPVGSLFFKVETETTTETVKILKNI